MGNWTPSIVPGGTSRTVYLVLNDFGRLGRSYLETGEDEADLETIISGMLEGQYSNPVDVFAFNAAEEWARDVSEYVADEIRHRCDRQGIDIRTSKHSWTVTKTETGGSSRCGSYERQADGLTA